jgi:hypothetical protein
VPRNLALTGHYGSGKSSVLVEVERRLGPRAMNLALSSLGADATRLGRVDDEGKPPALTNLIQKEIVKQLLYRERPAKMRGSHYPRIDQFRILPAVGWALVVAGTFAAVSVLAGLEFRIRDMLTMLLPLGFEWSAWAAVMTLSLLTGVLGFFILRALHGRVRIEKLSAGPAAVSLTNAGNTYFDEYLDEIVFYFQRSGVRVVVFEDLDRFNDPHIFETLRELNTVLNNSKQIRAKPITFVYAIRDSIFQLLDANDPVLERLEDAPATQSPAADSSADSGPADGRHESPVTSRTKFFDLVVPIVPFLSHRTARDKLRKVFSDLPSAPSKAVMDVVAPYLTDMRLIKNIRNEYAVFAGRILPPRGKANLNPDRLFAMVVYKNVQMQDFEDIREGNGRIDDVYEAYRALVTRHAARCDTEIRTARTRLANISSAGPRAGVYGRRLGEVLPILAPLTGYSWSPSTTIRTNRDGFTVRDANTEEFWATASAAGGIALPQWGNRSLDAAALSTLLGLPLEPEDWQESRRAEFELAIQRAEELKEFVTHASMQQIIGRSDLKLPYPTDDGPETSLADIARQKLAPVALDLLEDDEGYIDQNYTLYVADYEGVSVSTAAMNYILQAVQPDRMDIRYRFASPDDIDAVIAEEGNRFLRGLSIRNIEVFNHLLRSAPSRLTPALVTIGTGPVQEAEEFLDAYVTGGEFPESLVQLLAPHFKGVFVYVTTLDGLPNDLSPRMIDAAFEGANPDVRYDVDDDVREKICATYQQMKVFTGDSHDHRAAEIGRLTDDLGIRFAEISPLAPKVRDEIIKRCLYPITADNLRASVGDDSSLALDSIKSAQPVVYEHALANLRDYLAAMDDLEFPTVESPANYIDVLSDVLANDPESVLEIAESAHPSCLVEDLGDLDSAAWPALADARRLAFTVTNAMAYVDSYGIDEHFVGLCVAEQTFQDPTTQEGAARQRLAVALASSPLLTPAVRVALLKSLHLQDPLDPATITASGFEALPDMVAGGVVKDSPDTFAKVATSPWELRERLIAASPNAATFVSELTLDGEDVLRLFESEVVSDAVRAAVCDNLSSFLADLGVVQAAAICRWAADHQHAISPDHLVALHHAGASAGDVVRALSVNVANLDLDTVRIVTDDLGEPFSELTNIGDRRMKTVPASPATEALLEQLRRLGTVSTFRLSGGFTRQYEVWTKRVAN